MGANANTSNVDLERKVAALEQALNEAQDAVRRLGQENSNLVSTVARLSDNTSKNTVEVEGLKRAVTQLASKKTAAGVSSY